MPLLSDRTAADIEGQSDQRAPVNNFQNKIIERILCSFSIEVWTPNFYIHNVNQVTGKNAVQS